MTGRDVSFPEAIRSGLTKYFDFQGRAQRAEYWWFILFTFLGSLVTGLVDAVLFGWDESDATPVSSLFSLAVFIPSLAVGWRRMHDIGRSGWWTLLPYVMLIFGIIGVVTLGVTETASFVSIVGLFGLAVASWIYVLVLLCRDSDPHSNIYGPSPKYGADADIFA